MKFATYADGTRDGRLVVVSRDLARALPAAGVAPTLIAALQQWDDVAAGLEVLSRDVNGDEGERFDPTRCMAPPPRAPQWLDASAFLNHARLMDRAFNNPVNPDVETIPMIYQGASDDFRGPYEPIEFPDESLQIDMEGEFGVIVSQVPMGTPEEQALSHVRLLVQINDWSLRALAPREMRTGFGWIQAKPSSSFAPVAITPDELGPHWSDGRIALRLHVAINGREVGRASGAEMQFPFQRLIAHCAFTRRLSAGTVIGSGTVSNEDRASGSSCLSEVRVIEKIDRGAPVTPFLSFGDYVRMEARLPDGSTPFGALDQAVMKAD